MRNFEQQLIQYAHYHRDHRNILTHFIGIPLIVLAIMVLLSKPSIDLVGTKLTPAIIIASISCVYYLILNLRYGLVMLVFYAGLLGLAMRISAESQTVWLISGISLFIVGWIAQFIGHFYEGKKPAFVDDLIGLIIGPLFIVVEAGFVFGLNKALATTIDNAAGDRR